MTGHEAKLPAGSSGERDRGHLREILSVKASILVFSSDDHLLMGRKDSSRRRDLGVWHLPGGKVEEGQSLEIAAILAVEQQAGLRLAPEQLTVVPLVGEDERVQALTTGETVWCRIKLNRLQVRLDQTAAELGRQTQPGGDLVALRWLSPEQLADVEHVPGVREFLVRAGYIQPRSSYRAGA